MIILLHVWWHNKILILKIKLPAKNLTDERSIDVCEIFVVGPQYEVTTIKFCLKQFHPVENPITFFFPGMPVQLSASQGFADKSYHMDPTILMI